MTDFFISYTDVDRPWAEWIAWQLEAAGYTTVLQAWDFRPGANFAWAMQHAVAESERTIAVLSPAYLQSGFTAAEWTAAFARDPTGTQGLLLPVRIHDCEPRGLLPQIVYIDLVGLDAEAARETLLAGVRRQRTKPTRAPGFPGPSPRPVTTPPLFPGASPPALKPYPTQSTSEDDQFRRNRRQMLEKVRHTWIQGLLEPSLSQLARLELGLETKPDAVDRSFDLLVQRPQQAPHPLPPGTPISQIFDDAGNALLILGEPGAGKTTLLLELTRDLLARAHQDERHLIPVVFNLASWAEQRSALADWLVDELNKRYDVPRKLGQAWVDAEVILPLLDGLDEVATAYRAACVETINVFIHEHGLLPLVVCSRIADYEALAVRLRVPSAVLIQALRWPQVQQYVEQAGASLAGLRTVLHNDTTLRELLNTPLMLSIVALAYHGHAAEEIHAAGTVEEHRTHVFAAYTEAMFHRRTQTRPYTRAQTEHWLTWLAKAMKDHSQTIFYLEWMQPDWLVVTSQQQLVTSVSSVMRGLCGGLLGGLSFGLGRGFAEGLAQGLATVWSFGIFLGLCFGMIRNPLIVGLVAGLLLGLSAVHHYVFAQGLVEGLVKGLGEGLTVGLALGLGAGLVRDSKEIRPVEKLRWSWSAVRSKWINRLFKRLAFGLAIALSFRLGDLISLWFTLREMLWERWFTYDELVFGLRHGLADDLDLVFVLRFGLPLGLSVVLLGLGDGLTVGEIGSQSFPNEGIRRSLRNACISGLVGWLSFGLAFGLGTRNLVAGLAIGSIFGLLLGLRFGGGACLNHFALRLVLWHKNCAPLRYIRFLDHATNRIFLRKVGGGYIFVHRMLLEYFAAMVQTRDSSLADAVTTFKTLLWTAYALNVLSLFVELGRAKEEEVVPMLIFFILWFGFAAWLNVMLLRGKNWARMVNLALLLLIVSVAFSIQPDQSGAYPSGVQVALSMVFLILSIWLIRMMFTEPIKGLFVRRG